MTYDAKSEAVEKILKESGLDTNIDPFSSEKVLSKLDSGLQDQGLSLTPAWRDALKAAATADKINANFTPSQAAPTYNFHGAAHYALSDIFGLSSSMPPETVKENIALRSPEARKQYLELVKPVAAAKSGIFSRITSALQPTTS